MKRKRHVFISGNLDDLKDLKHVINKAIKVAEAAVEQESEDCEDGENPDVRIKIENREYSDDWDVSVAY